MRVPPIRVRFLPLAGWLAAFAVSCAPAIVIRSMPEQPLADAWGIAVYPVNFELQTSAYEAYARGEAIAEWLAATTGKRIYGPGEFEVRSFDGDDARKSTDLMAQVRFNREHLPDGLYAIRTTVQQRVTIGTAAALDARTGETTTRKEETIDVLVRMELLSLKAHGVVAEAEGKARVDPFALATEADAFPDVTRLTRLLASTLVQRSGLAAGTPPVVDLKVVALPKAALEFASPAIVEATRPDSLEQEARLLQLLQAVDPTAPRERERVYKHEPYGLMVLEPGSLGARAGLETGDLLQEGNGERLVDRHTLIRLLEDGPVRVRFARGGEERETDLSP